MEYKLLKYLSKKMTKMNL